MKRYWLIITAMLCVLMLSACVAQENRDIPASENSNSGVSENIDVRKSENSDSNVSESSNASVSESSNTGTNETSDTQEDETEMKMNVQIGDYTFTATLEQNQAVNELIDMMKEGPVTIEMSDYSGFEKVGPLGKGLTTDNHQTTTTEGDIVLYNGNQIVIFYGSNSWSYTRIGKINDLTNWKKALGSEDVTAVLTVAE